jgi:hypothetical protein
MGPKCGITAQEGTDFIIEDFLEVNDVGVALAGAQQIDLSAAIDSTRDDLDGELLPSGFVHATPAHGKAAIAQHGLPQVHVIVLEERRILRDNVTRDTKIGG